MLTDYSSIYFDYLLTDKPIGLTWEDYEEYKLRPGFVENIEFLTSGGEKIFTAKDLSLFLSNLIEIYSYIMYNTSIIKEGGTVYLC